MATIVTLDINEWITYLVLLFGTVYFITHSAIFTLPRVVIASRGRWVEIFIYCAACTGTWAGLLLGLTGRWPLEHGLTGAGVLDSTLAGMVLGLWWGAKQREWSGYAAHTNERDLIQQIRDERHARTLTPERMEELKQSSQAALDLLKRNEEARDAAVDALLEKRNAGKARDAAEAEPEAEG